MAPVTVVALYQAERKGRFGFWIPCCGLQFFSGQKRNHLSLDIHVSCRFCLNDSWFLQEFSSRFMIHEDVLITLTKWFSHTSILLSFSQSLVIHDSRAEVQKLMILTYFITTIHDSASTLDSGTRQDYKTRWFIKLSSDPGFLFSKNWIPDFNHWPFLC